MRALARRASIALLGLGVAGLVGCAEPAGSDEINEANGPQEALGEAQQAAAVTPTFCATLRRGPGTPAYDTSVYVNKPTTNYGTATAIIVRAIGDCAPEDRPQWVAFFVMMLVPWGANMAYLVGGVRLMGGDPTPLSFAIAVVPASATNPSEQARKSPVR